MEPAHRLRPMEEASSDELQGQRERPRTVPEGRGKIIYLIKKSSRLALLPLVAAAS